MPRMLKKWLEQRNEKILEMRAIVEGAKKEERALTEDELKQFEEIKKAVAALDATINAEKEAEDAETKETKKEKEEGDNGEDAEERALDVKNFASYIRGEKRALDVANNGGVIGKTIVNQIIEEVKELSPIYSMATKYNVGGDLVFPVYNESEDAGAAFVEDMQELTESAGKFTTVELKNFIVGVLKLVSKSLLNRSDFDLVGFVVKKVAENIAEFLEKSLLLGTAGKNQGVFETENVVVSSAANVITADELIDLQMKVPQPFQTKACWIMHKKTFQKIRKLKNNDGEYLLNKDLKGGFGWELLGKPVYVSDNAPEMETGKTAIVYGDMNGLYVKLAKDMEVQVLTEKFATRYAVGVVGYVEFDSRIIETQKIAGLKMKGTA